MHEQSKLNEATYFLGRMSSEVDKRGDLLFDLSAFLSAARSVLQYSLKEAGASSAGKHWYDSQIASSTVLSFFKRKRDINVHEQPLEINQNTSIEITETIRISESVHIKVFDKDGNLVDEHFSQSPPSPKAEDVPPKVTYLYSFPDWIGKEDALQLCHLYLKELQRVVEDGKKRKFISA